MYCHPGVIQRLTQTQNGVNIVETWSTISAAFAAIEPTGGNESEIAKQLQATATHKLSFPYLSGVKASDRFVCGSRTFYFVAPPINVGERNLKLEVLAAERE